MKKFNINFLILLLILIVCSSCGIGVNYIGDNWSPTDKVDVFYDAKDVNHSYKVIGHISVQALLTENDIKQRIIQKAKAVGSDAVIINGKDYTGGKDSEPFYKADAIKYIN